MLRRKKSPVIIRKPVPGRRRGWPRTNRPCLTIGETWLKDNIKKILFDKVYYTKGERKLAVSAIKEQLEAYLITQGLTGDNRDFIIKKFVEKTIDAEVTDAILKEKKPRRRPSA